MRRPISITVALSCSVMGVLLSPNIARSQSCSGNFTCDDNGDIPFRVYTVDVNIPPTWYLTCSGPWGRLSNPTPVAFIQDAINSKGYCAFYAANEVLGFEPYGDWSCSLTPNCLGEQPDPPDTAFCLDSNKDAAEIVAMDLKLSAPRVTARNKAKAGECVTVGARSTLDGVRDQDDFEFTGQAGDTIVVTVTPDRKNGHNNGQATLSTSIDRKLKKTGTLPLTLTAVLPASGNYTVTVEQATGKTSEQFRGTYHVSVQSLSENGLPPLRPLSNVE